MTRGSELASIRKRRKLSQLGLARLMGVSRSFISKLEVAMKQPSRDFIQRLQETLELDADEHQRLLNAVAFGKRRIVLGRHLDRERVELIHHFVNRIEGLE